jgi:hypothetical protein
MAAHVRLSADGDLASRLAETGVTALARVANARERHEVPVTMTSQALQPSALTSAIGP